MLSQCVKYVQLVNEKGDDKVLIVEQHNWLFYVLIGWVLFRFSSILEQKISFLCDNSKTIFSDELQLKIMDKYMRIDINNTEECEFLEEGEEVEESEEQVEQERHELEIESYPQIKNPKKAVMKMRRFNKSEVQKMKSQFTSQNGYQFDSIVEDTMELFTQACTILFSFYYFGWKALLLLAKVKIDGWM